jgi:hypothetical protein
MTPRCDPAHRCSVRKSGPCRALMYDRRTRPDRVLRRQGCCTAECDGKNQE